jgi:hypothetical protein
MEQGTIRVYDPTAEPRASGFRPANRKPTLHGATIGVLDNGKANAGMLMTAVTDLLKEQFGVAEIIVRRKPVAGPASPQVIADLKERCAGVLVGSAD